MLQWLCVWDTRWRVDFPFTFLIFLTLRTGKGSSGCWMKVVKWWVLGEEKVNYGDVVLFWWLHRWRDGGSGYWLWLLFCFVLSLQNVQLMLILHFDVSDVFQNSNWYVATHLASATRAGDFVNSGFFHTELLGFRTLSIKLILNN
jgi:hypothetical protein